jgi:hypothetical protein
MRAIPAFRFNAGATPDSAMTFSSISCRRSALQPHGAWSKLLAQVWGGCSQASGHATTDTHVHHPINEKPLAEALTIILDYLQAGIYDTAGTKLRDYLLELA